MRKATTIIPGVLLAGLFGLAVHSYLNPRYIDLRPEGAAWTFCHVDCGWVTFLYASNGDPPDPTAGRVPKTPRQTQRLNRYARALSSCQWWKSAADAIRQQAPKWPGYDAPYPEGVENGTMGEAWMRIVDECLRNIRKPYAGELARFASEDGILGFYWFYDNTSQREIVARFPCWGPTVLLAPVFFVLVRAEWIARRRRRTGCCLTCGYNLTGNVSGICPECGTATLRGSTLASSSP